MRYLDGALSLERGSGQEAILLKPVSNAKRQRSMVCRSNTA